MGNGVTPRDGAQVVLTCDEAFHGDQAVRVGVFFYTTLPDAVPWGFSRAVGGPAVVENVPLEGDSVLYRADPDFDEVDESLVRLRYKITCDCGLELVMRPDGGQVAGILGALADGGVEGIALGRLLRLASKGV